MIIIKECKKRICTSIILLLIGILICLVSLTVIPIDPGSINVPFWLLFLIGLLIISGGLAAFAPIYSRTSNLFAAIAITLFALLLTWIVIGGKSSAFSGGIPFLPPTANFFTGRLVFGFFALIL